MNRPENPRCAYLRPRRTTATKDAMQLAFFKLESLQLRFLQYLEYYPPPDSPERISDSALSSKVYII
jgi:hypothetical protein